MSKGQSPALNEPSHERRGKIRDKAVWSVRVVNGYILKINSHHCDCILERYRQRILPSLQCVWWEPQLVFKCKHKVLFEDGRDFSEKGWWLWGIEQDAWYGLMLFCGQQEWTCQTWLCAHPKSELGSWSGCVLCWAEIKQGQGVGGMWDKKSCCLGKSVLSVFRGELCTRKMLFQWYARPIQVDAQNKPPGWYLPESELFCPLQPLMDLCLVTCLGWIYVKETTCPGTFWDWAVKQTYMELCFRETLWRWMGCGKIQPTYSPIRLLLPLCNLTTKVRVCTFNSASGKVSGCNSCYSVNSCILQAELCITACLALFTSPKLLSLHLIPEENGRYRTLSHYPRLIP